MAQCAWQCRMTYEMLRKSAYQSAMSGFSHGPTDGRRFPKTRNAFKVQIVAAGRVAGPIQDTYKGMKLEGCLRPCSKIGAWARMAIQPRRVSKFSKVGKWKELWRQCIYVIHGRDYLGILIQGRSDYFYGALTLAHAHRHTETYTHPQAPKCPK